MRAVLLLNTTAGRVRSEPALANPDTWRRWFEAAGIAVEIWCGPAGDLESAARQAAQSPVDCVAVAGGDGTVHTVAQVFAGDPKPLAVLPAGTLNHFARDVGMPMDLDAAVRVIAAGYVRRIDLGEVQSRVFVNNSSVGIYSRMVLLRDALRPHSRWGKFLAMFRAFVRVLRRFPRLTVTLHVQGQTVTRTVPLVLVSNNPYETGWPRLGRRTALDSGLLSVYVVRCSTRFSLLRCIFQALRNRLDAIGSIESFVAAEVTIAPRRKHVFVSLDGEVERLAGPLTYRSRPRALAIIAPEPSAAPQISTITSAVQPSAVGAHLRP
jgi:diacylglycerol kinase family enzyme